MGSHSRGRGINKAQCISYRFQLLSGSNVERGVNNYEVKELCRARAQRARLASDEGASASDDDVGGGAGARTNEVRTSDLSDDERSEEE